MVIFGSTGVSVLAFPTLRPIFIACLMSFYCLLLISNLLFVPPSFNDAFAEFRVKPGKKYVIVLVFFQFCLHWNTVMCYIN